MYVCVHIDAVYYLVLCNLPTGSDSSFSAVEDTHSPPVRVVSFSSEGVVFEDYSEQTRQDPVGGE